MHKILLERQTFAALWWSWCCVCFGHMCALVYVYVFWHCYIQISKLLFFQFWLEMNANRSGLYRGIFLKYTWFRWHKVFWMCLGIRRKKIFIFFWKKCIFQGLQSKTVRAKWPFWAVYSNFTPSVLKKYLNDVSETYRYHDTVIHLCKFKISDLYLFFHGPGGVGNDCAKH